MSETRNSLPNINGYQLLENWNTSGSCRWSYAVKDGRQWFIKQFMAPKYKRAEDGFSPKKVESSRIRCEAFQKSQTALYSRIRNANTGNIVAVDSFFSYESMFYAVTPRIDVSSVSTGDIARMGYGQKLILLKVLTHSINSLHKNGVVHADLKPDNVLVKKTQTGYTLKLIDFDASFLEMQPKRGEEICFDASFVAPETIDACGDRTMSLTRKIDIFALGLLFHLYYTGHMPKTPEGFPNACSVVRDGKIPQIDSEIPDWLRQLISAMLLRDPEDRPNADQVFQMLLDQKYTPLSRKKGFHSPTKLPPKG